MTIRIENVIAVQLKSVANNSDFCIVRLETRAGTGQPFHYVAMTPRAFTSLCKLAGNLEGPYDVELLQYSEKMMSLVTDVIVIEHKADKE